MSVDFDRLRGMYDHSPVMIAAYDSFDRLRYANPAFRAAYFIDPDEEPFWPDLMRRNHKAGRGTVIRSDDFEAWLFSTSSRRGKIGVRAFETDLADGRWLWMTESVEADGWMLCIAVDITSIRADERAVRQDLDHAIKAAYTDELTGVANRRFAMDRIEAMLKPPSPLGCVAILDLDNFKYINDRYGHPVGDLVLRDFARRIQAGLRRSDCFGRIGGEEFVLVMPDTSCAEAVLIVERMLAVIRGAGPLTDRPEFRYTFSAGVAESQAADSPAAICTRADRALYAAKLAGRSCVVADLDLPEITSAAG